MPAISMRTKTKSQMRDNLSGSTHIMTMSLIDKVSRLRSAKKVAPWDLLLSHILFMDSILSKALTFKLISLWSNGES